jgi:hypothetical protein
MSINTYALKREHPSRSQTKGSPGKQRGAQRDLPRLRGGKNENGEPLILTGEILNSAGGVVHKHWGGGLDCQ